MLKNKWIVAVLIASSFSLTSCLKDEVEDLQDDMNKVQSALGTNEPLTMKFSTKDYNNVDIVENTSYLFKSMGDNQYISNIGDGWYTIYIERFSDVNWEEGAWIDFNYNPTTKEVEVDDFGAYFYNQFGNYVSPYFYEADACEVSIKVNSFNAAAGTLAVEVTGTTTSGFGYNEYEGKPMTISLTFNGSAPVFDWTAGS